MTDVDLIELLEEKPKWRSVQSRRFKIERREEKIKQLQQEIEDIYQEIGEIIAECKEGDIIQYNSDNSKKKKVIDVDPIDIKSSLVYAVDLDGNGDETGEVVQYGSRHIAKNFSTIR